MATPAQQRTVFLTFAAAALTVVVVLLVVGGPAVMECTGRNAPLDTCLRDKVASFGLLPDRVDGPEATPQVEALATETAPAPAPVVAAPAGPQLDFIRAEPNGSVIIAGTGRPGEDVSVFANGALLGRVTPEPSGDWAMVPDAPLPPGGTAITVRAGSTTAPRAFVVVIDPGRTAEPQVIETVADEVETVLGGLPRVAPADSAAEAEEAAPDNDNPAVPEAVPDETSEPAAGAVSDAALLAVRDVELALADPQSAPAPQRVEDAVADGAAPAPTMADAAALAAHDVAAALAHPTIVLPPAATAVDAAAALAAQDVLVAADEASDTARAITQAQRDVEVALAQPHEIEIVQPAPAVTPAPQQPARELALADVAAALADPLVVEPPALGPDPAEQAGALAARDVALAIAAPLTLEAPDPAGQAGARDVEVALADPVLIEPPAPTSPSELAAGLALNDVRLALADPVVVEQPAVGPDPAEQAGALAARDVALAIATPRTLEAPDPAGQAGAGDVEVALADPAPIVARPTIEAIEVDGDQSYFAGAGEEGATIRLHVEDALVGETTIVDGRWLIEAGGVLALPSQRVRIEMLRDGARVGAAEVDFMIDLPAPDAVAPTAPADPATELALAPDAGQSRQAGAARDTALPNEAVPSERPARLEVTTNDPEPRAGPARIETREHAGDLATNPARREASLPSPTAGESEEPGPQLAAPAEVAVLGTPPDVAATPAVVPEEVAGEALEIAATDPEASPAVEIPTIVAAPGDIDVMRFATGTAIIRRGDTLWDIAERVYGDGWKYQTIYRANRDVIPRPGKIRPGQVLTIPLVFDDH